MAIVAVCPYCKEGKVRAPANAVGQSATCPRCQSCFTIVESNEPQAPKAGPAAVRATGLAPKAAKPVALSPSPKPMAAAATAAVSEPDESLGDLTVETPEPIPTVTLPPARPIPVEPTAYSPQRETSFVVGLIAIIIAGVGLGASQLPFGRISTTVLTLIGLVVGVFALLITERKYLVPALGSAANGLGLLLAVALPGWLGLKTWIPDRKIEEPKIAKAVGYDGEVPVVADWVDVSRASWQMDDVRVTVKSTTITPVELIGPMNQKKSTKEKYLVIWVQVKNAGVARQIDFRGWNNVEKPGMFVPRLTDSANKPIAIKVFEGEFQPAASKEFKPLLPASTSDQLLYFVLPEPKVEYLNLELPPEPFGGTAPVRLKIPRGSILYRS